MVTNINGHDIADLREASVIQMEMNQARMALETGKEAINYWLHILDEVQNSEHLSYEDAVTLEFRTFTDARITLWHLQKKIVETTRILGAHRQELKQQT